MRTFVATALAVLALAVPARSQEPSPEAEAEMVRVASIAPWTGPDEPFSVTLQVTNTSEVALNGLSVQLSVFGSVISRSQLRLALDRGQQTPLVSATTEAFDDPVEPGEQRTITVERTMSSLSVSQTGVYPLVVTLGHAAGAVEFRTAVPYIAAEPEQRLNVAWVVPVNAPTVRRPGGVLATDAVALLAPDEITQQMDAIARRPNANVTLAPSASLLDTLADMRDGFALESPAGVDAQGDSSPDAIAAGAALDAIERAAAVAAEIAPTPYVAADLPALEARGPRGDLLRQVTLGRTVTSELLGRTPATNLLVPPGFRLDQAAALALGSVGVSHALIDPESLPEPPVEPAHLRPDLFGPSTPVTLRLRDRALTAVLPDPALRARMAGAEQGALLSQTLIAETASAWLELPGFAEQRLVVIAPDRAPAPTAIAAALDGMLDAPWIRLRSLPDAFASIEAQGRPLPLPRLVTPDTAPMAAARDARRSMGALTQVTVSTPEEIDDLDRQILLAESAEWIAAPETGTALARAVSERVRGVFTQVRIAQRTVTLTSRTGALPVTVINDNPFPVRVRIRLDSARVGFPSGSSRIEEVESGDQTFDFPVEARATGAFPVGVIVETPDGRVRITGGSLTVRSTAVSAVALTATGGGVFFLFLAWARRARRRDAARAGA